MYGIISFYQMTSASPMHEAGHSKSVLWDKPERGVEGGGINVHPWLIHVDIWQKPIKINK